MRKSLLPVAAVLAFAGSACTGEEIVVKREVTTVVRQELVEAEAIDTEGSVSRQELSESEVNLEVIRVELDTSQYENSIRVPARDDASELEDSADEDSAAEDSEGAPSPATPGGNVVLLASASVDGTTYEAGYFTGTLNVEGVDLSSAPQATGEDGFLVMRDPNGEVLGYTVFSSDRLDSVYGVMPFNGSAIVYGSFQSVLTGPGFQLESVGESDIFVAQVDQGQVSWVRQIGTTGYDILTDGAARSNDSLIFVGSVDGGANGSDGVVCTLRGDQGDISCERSETSADDRFVKILNAAGESVVTVEVETTSSSGTATSEEIEVAQPTDAGSLELPATSDDPASGNTADGDLADGAEPGDVVDDPKGVVVRESAR